MQVPLVSFRSTEDLRRALWPPQLSWEYIRSGGADQFQNLVSRGLPPLVSMRALGVILGVNPKLITSMARFPQRHYHEYRIPKKSGGERVILAPRVFLKTVQRYVLRSILETRPLPEFVHGFVRGRGIVSNGSAHQAAPYVLNVDISNFFDSVREQSVRQTFLDFGFSEHVARSLTGLCTYKGSLPQGAPTSPYLANLAFQKADGDILGLAAGLNLKYSRYADDLTFSGGQKIPREFLERLRAILRQHGFQVNSKKIRFSGPGQARYVTGMVVNEKVHPERSQRRMLRAMFHRAMQSPEESQERVNEILGWASFVNSYNPALGRRYLAIARQLKPTGAP